jgi:hypothetical protein
VRDRRGAVSLVALVALVAAACSRPEVAAPPVLPWTLHETVCERVPMHALVQGAGWRLDASAVKDSYHESELGARAVCWARGELDYQARTTPIDGGQLIVDLYAANGAEGLARVAELYALQGPHAEVFPMLGRPVRTNEEAIEGWWTDGSLKVYSQVGIPGDPAAVRAVARAQMTDDNVTVVVTTMAYVRGNSPRSIDRLEQLTLDTAAATQRALDVRDGG